MSQIPEPTPPNKDLEIIPSETVAELPSDFPDPEIAPYRLSFAKYNEKMCEIDGMNRDNSAAGLKIVRDVGIYFTNQNNFQLKSKHVQQIKPVIRDGDYAALYKGLGIDEDIKEIVYTKNQKGKEVDIRLFFHAIEPEKTFYVIALRESHIDTSKSRGF